MFTAVAPSPSTALALVLSVLVPSLAQAQSDATGADLLAEKPKIAVLDLSFTEAVGEDLPRALGAMISSQLAATGAFEVITQDDVRQMIGFDKLKTALSCEADSSCLAEIGGALGVPWLITGSIAKVGPEWVLSLALIEIEQSRTAGREVVHGESDTALIAALPRAVQALVRPLLAGRMGTLSLAALEEGAVVEVDGRALGTTPLPPVSLTEGTHRVVVRKAGFFEQEIDVEVASGKELVIEVRLEQADLDDDPRFFYIAGGTLTALGVMLTLAGYGASALLGFSYSAIGRYSLIAPWLYVPAVGPLVFAYTVASSDRPEEIGAGNAAAATNLSLAAVSTQALGSVVGASGLALIGWGLTE